MKCRRRQVHLGLGGRKVSDETLSDFPWKKFFWFDWNGLGKEKLNSFNDWQELKSLIRIILTEWSNWMKILRFNRWKAGMTFNCWFITQFRHLTDFIHFIHFTSNDFIFIVSVTSKEIWFSETSVLFKTKGNHFLKFAVQKLFPFQSEMLMNKNVPFSAEMTRICSDQNVWRHGWHFVLSFVFPKDIDLVFN
jgi:hypothetical protein